jgi:hypothetical protein
LAASTPYKRREPEETPEHVFADSRNLIHMLRAMKSQKDHGGNALWEFEIDSESAKAELFHKMLRLIR